MVITNTLQLERMQRYGLRMLMALCHVVQEELMDSRVRAEVDFRDVELLETSSQKLLLLKAFLGVSQQRPSHP